LAKHVPGTFKLENSKCIDYSFSFIQNTLQAKMYPTMTPARVNEEKNTSIIKGKYSFSCTFVCCPRDML
jgi:hypothetical protein